MRACTRDAPCVYHPFCLQVDLRPDLLFELLADPNQHTTIFDAIEVRGLCTLLLQPVCARPMTERGLSHTCAALLTLQGASCRLVAEEGPWRK